MSPAIPVGALFVLVGLAGLALLARAWPARTRGRHRAVVDDAVFGELLAAGALEVSDFFWCPECCGRRYCAIQADGTVRCWTCRTEVDALGPNTTTQKGD